MAATETVAFLLQTAVVTRALFLLPFEGRRKYLRLAAEVRRDPRARTRFFRRFLVVWWVSAAIVLATVTWGADTPAQLRLVAPRAIAWPLLGAWLAILAWPVLRARRKGAYQDAVREQLARVPALAPATAGERWLFAAVSITAGICEELVFRGLVPLWFAKLLPGSAFGFVGPFASVLGFGLGHAYQGSRGIAIATVLGAIFMGVTTLSGSVIPAMAFHAANDLRFLALLLTLGRTVVDKPGEIP